MHKIIIQNRITGKTGCALEILSRKQAVVLSYIAAIASIAINTLICADPLNHISTTPGRSSACQSASIYPKIAAFVCTATWLHHFIFPQIRQN